MADIRSFFGSTCSPEAAQPAPEQARLRAAPTPSTAQKRKPDDAPAALRSKKPGTTFAQKADAILAQLAATKREWDARELNAAGKAEERPQPGAGGAQQSDEDREADAVKQRLCASLIKAVKRAGQTGKNKPRSEATAEHLDAGMAARVCRGLVQVSDSPRMSVWKEGQQLDAISRWLKTDPLIPNVPTKVKDLFGSREIPQTVLFCGLEVKYKKAEQTLLVCIRTETRENAGRASGRGSIGVQLINGTYEDDAAYIQRRAREYAEEDALAPDAAGPAARAAAEAPSVVSKAATKAAKAAAQEKVESAEASTLAALGEGYVKIVLKEGARDGKGRQVAFVKDCVREELHSVEKEIYEDPEADENEITAQLEMGIISAQEAAKEREERAKLKAREKEVEAALASVGQSMPRFRMTNTKDSYYAHAVMNKRVDLATEALEEKNYYTAFARAFALTVAGFDDSYWYTDTDDYEACREIVERCQGLWRTLLAQPDNVLGINAETRSAAKYAMRSAAARVRSEGPGGLQSGFGWE